MSVFKNTSLSRGTFIILSLIIFYIAANLIRTHQTAGQWDVFVSEYYGFSMDYPANWFIGEVAPGNPPPKSNRAYQIIFRSGDGLVVRRDATVTIFVFPASTRPLQEIAEQYPTQITDNIFVQYPTATITVGVDNFPAISQGFVFTDLNDLQVFHVELDEQLLVFEMKVFESSELTEYSIIFEQMLSTIKINTNAP